MSVDDIVFLGERALFVTLMASAPMLLSGMIVGLLISIFQSVTQIQEMTLSFVPKIIAVMVSFIIFLPWMVSLVLQFVQPLLANADKLVK
jgi:flagellar biosynthetic protein FliQ